MTIQLNMLEAAYKADVDILELAKFYESANSELHKEVERAASKADWEYFKKMVKRCLESL
jgi:hypothetical protein